MLRRPPDPNPPTPEASRRLEALRADIARGRASGPGLAADEAFARIRARIDAMEGGAESDETAA